MEAEEFLEHHGVKGMKWGVRRHLQGLSTIAERQSYLSGKDSKWIAKVNANPKLAKMARISARDAKKQIKTLNQEYKKAGHNVRKNGLQQTRYDNEVASILQHSAERAAYKTHGRSGTGLLEVTVHRHPDGNVSAYIGQRSNVKITKQIQKINKHDARVNNEAHQEKLRAFNNTLGHSDDTALTFADFDGLEFNLSVDADGFIDDVTTPFDDLAQSNLDAIEEFLQHHGVRGMKWGQHRFGRVQTGTPSGFVKTKVVVQRMADGTHKITDIKTGKKIHGDVIDAKTGKKLQATKPPWQSSPSKRSKTVEVPAVIKKEKGPKPSADALEIHALREKVKKHGSSSLTNEDLQKIAKRAELQQKYQKAYPKKKSKKSIAAGLAIDLALSEFGATKISGFVGAKKGAEAATKVGELLKTAGQAKKLHDALNKK